MLTELETRQLRERHAKCNEVGLAVEQLGDKLTHDPAALNARMASLITLAREMHPDPIWAELAELSWDSGLDFLIRWEADELAAKFRGTVDDMDILHFETGDGEFGYSLRLNGRKKGIDRLYLSSWLRSEFPVLRATQDVIERHSDIMGEHSLAGEIVQCHVLLVYVCLLVGDFCAVQGPLMRACHRRKLVRMCYFATNVYRIGVVEDGFFLRHPTPLGTGDIGDASE